MKVSDAAKYSGNENVTSEGINKNDRLGVQKSEKQKYALKRARIAIFKVKYAYLATSGCSQIVNDHLGTSSSKEKGIRLTQATTSTSDNANTAVVAQFVGHFRVQY